MDREKLYREMAAVIRADIMTDMAGVEPTLQNMRTACARSVASIMSPLNLRITVSEDLQRVTIVHEEP